MTQPKIQIKLTTGQLENLIPPGSEMELALSSACIENYTDRITKRVVDKLVGKKDIAIHNAILEAEKQVATKEWHRSSATISQTTKDAINHEIKNAVGIVVRAEVSTVIKEYVCSDDLKAYVNAVVKGHIDRLTKEALEDRAKKAIKDKLAAMAESSLV